MPESLGIETMKEAEEIKEGAALPPGIAVPAGATWSRRSIHPKRRVTIFAIAMMLSERTAAQPASIQAHAAANHLVGVLRGTPVLYRRRWGSSHTPRGFC